MQPISLPQENAFAHPAFSRVVKSLRVTVIVEFVEAYPQVHIGEFMQM